MKTSRNQLFGGLNDLEFAQTLSAHRFRRRLYLEDCLEELVARFGEAAREGTTYEALEMELNALKAGRSPMLVHMHRVRTS